MTYKEYVKNFDIRLNEQQMEAVRADKGATLLLAVPGSGKTTALVARLGYMIFCGGVAPEDILTMTYTVAAARDMRERFASVFGNSMAERLEFRTINGVSARIIRLYELRYDRHAFRLISDERELTGVLGEIYSKVSSEIATESDIKTLRTSITYAKNMMLDDGELRELEKELDGFCEMFRLYNERLKQQECMDYDDQMVYAWQILRRCPELLQELRSRYRHICVDEAQDTSKIQHMIIELLARGGESLFMVGDEDQSIYGFRAAYPKALMDFEKVYPGAGVMLLEKNYRSTRQIVEAANKFIRKNTERRDKHMTDVRGDGAEVTEISVKDRSAQYAYLEEVAAGCRVETAVLYRDNDNALPLIDRLERSGIPYRCRRMDGTFFSNRVVRDISDIIRFAYDPKDGSNFMRIYYKLGARISRKFAEAAVSVAAGRYDILDTLIYIDGLPKWTLYRCQSLQNDFAALVDERADKAIYRIVNYMGYGDYLEQRGYEENKSQILRALGEHEATPLRLLERLDELQELIKESRGEAACKFVLSTIHSSKGLEYERVFLMDVIDGVLPKTRMAADGEISEDDREAYEEERRLFYVGMTRAKNELCLFTFTNAEQRTSFAEEIFPKKVNTKPEAHYTLGPMNGQQSDSSGVPDVGSEVIHRKFGRGSIVNKVGDIITVKFADGQEKRLSLSASMRNGTLRTKKVKNNVVNCK